MRVGISFGIGGKVWEFCWGKSTAKYALVELSGTILTVQVSFYIKV